MIRSVVMALTLLVPAIAELPPPQDAALVIASEDAAGPWGRADGTGCGNDIVLAAYAAVNEPVKLEVMPYSRAKIGVLEGRYVGCFGMAWTDDLKGKVVFADKPLYSVTAVLVQSLARPLKATTAKELPAGTKVGTVFEYEYPPAFSELVKQGIVFPLAAYSEDASLKNLDLGRIDAALVVVDELKNLDFLIRQAGLEGRVGEAFAIGDQSTYVGFSTIHPAAARARQLFNKGLAVIAKNGTLKKIVDTWKAQPR